MKVEIRGYNVANMEDFLNAFESNVPIFFTENEVMQFASRNAGINLYSESRG